MRGRLIALASPDDLRRRAFGGDIVELRTAQNVEGVTLEGLPGVRSVRQSSARTLRVTTDEAGTAIPRLVQEIQDSGVQVVSTSEYRPSYDEVFAALVTEAESAVHDDEEGTHERDRRAVAGAA